MNRRIRIGSRLGGLITAVFLATAAVALAAVEELGITPAVSATDSIASPDKVQRDEVHRSPFDDLPRGIKATPYSIEGTSRQELSEAIRDSLGATLGASPDDHFGALTLSRYTFDTAGMPMLRRQEADDSCRCWASDSVAVTLDISIRYPLWTDMDACADSDLVDDWRTYLVGLYCHELGHVYIARAGLRELTGRLNGIEIEAKAEDCSSACLQAIESHYHQVEKTFFGISEEISKHHQRYDLETAHGRSQGARF
jgi:predicted secreted Zn-dependent protease